MKTSLPVTPKTSIPRAVVIGASAGALDALSGLLPLLPSNYPLPIMVVVHLPADKKSVLAELLKAKCNLDVVEAEDKMPVANGTVYIAPPDYHLLVEAGGYLSLSNEEAVLFSRPAIDVLFESAADVYDEALIGIILTGANQDGAQGLKAVTDAGGTAIVQDPGEAYADIMPEAALKSCPGAHVLPVGEIAAYLRKAVDQ